MEAESATDAEEAREVAGPGIHQELDLADKALDPMASHGENSAALGKPCRFPSQC